MVRRGASGRTGNSEDDGKGTQGQDSDSSLEVMERSHSGIKPRRHQIILSRPSAGAIKALHARVATVAQKASDADGSGFSLLAAWMMVSRLMVNPASTTLGVLGSSGFTGPET